MKEVSFTKNPLIYYNNFTMIVQAIYNL